jgi:hypothetical protein
MLNENVEHKLIVIKNTYNLFQVSPQNLHTGHNQGSEKNEASI